MRLRESRIEIVVHGAKRLAFLHRIAKPLVNLEADGGIPDEPPASRLECERHLLKHWHEHFDFRQRSHE